MSFSGSISRVDRIFRAFAITKFVKQCFSEGWGDPKIIKQIQEISKLQTTGSTKHHPEIFKDIEIHYKPEKTTTDHSTIYEGSFESPTEKFLPLESKTSYFQMVVPKKPNTLDAFSHLNEIPLIIHFGATGDHGFYVRRKFMAEDLSKKGFASIILENPYYGLRKPKKQFRSSLLYVADLMTMGLSLVSESLSILRHYRLLNKNLKQPNTESSISKEVESISFGPSALTGISMGGIMASLSASSSSHEISLIPCISPYSAAPVFCEGMLKEWCDWKILNKQLPDYRTRDDQTAKELLDELLSITDLTTYTIPKFSSGIIQVSAKHDGYVPGTGTILNEYWKESDLRWIDEGHVLSFTLGLKKFQTAIIDSLELLVDHQKTHPDIIDPTLP